jgi:hypothetical protein
MTIEIKVMDLDKPNLNGVIYTEQAIKNACSRIKGLDIPVIYNSDTTGDLFDGVDIGNIIGFASLLEENYPDMSFITTIEKESFIDLLKNGWGGFGPNCKVATKTDGSTITVTEATIDTIGYTMTPASKTYYKIIE